MVYDITPQCLYIDTQAIYPDWENQDILYCKNNFGSSALLPSLTNGILLWKAFEYAAQQQM